VAKCLGLATTGHLANNHPTGNHRQISRQRTPTTKSSQHSEIVGQQRQKHLGTQIVNVVRRKTDAAGMSHMIHHVHEQTDESVHEITPRTWLMLQATGQQAAIDFGECQRIA
jgi:polyphosphate kinase 2 (PPK2 family)